jgi:signal transduction histidine kinase
VIEGAHAVMHGTSGVVEYRLRVLGEAERIVRTRMFPVRERDDRVTRIAGLTEDVTEQRALEARLRQAQKMEAVGQLAGGIAHDFNNLLTVISANLEFARGDLPAALPADDPVREDLAEIGRAAERARDLVRQLLAFSRKQPVRLQPVRLAALVRDAEALLRRTLGEEIVLDVRVLDDPTVRADAGQLQQVLLNLAVNGRDAMLTARHGHAGTGGTLTITVDLAPAPLPTSTPAAALASGPAEPAGVRPWARVRVRDTGHGMDAATQAHLFEPFFTTKEVGAGTGLGLASSHGIVTQAGA